MLAAVATAQTANHMRAQAGHQVHVQAKVQAAMIPHSINTLQIHIHSCRFA